MFEGRFLVFLSYCGGVPVRKTLCGATVARKLEKLEIVKILLIYVLGFLVSPAWNLYLHVKGIMSISDWMSTFFENGMLMTDVICLYGNALISSVALYAFILFYWRNNVQISEIHQRLLSRQYLVPEEVKLKARRRNGLFLAIHFILGFFQSLTKGLTVQVGVFPNEPFSLPALITSLVLLMWYMLQYFSPFNLTMNWVNVDVLQLCGLNLKFWRLKLGQENLDAMDSLEKGSGKITQPELIRDGLDWAFELLEDIKTVNERMGLPILIDLTTSFTTFVVSLLFLSSFYNLFNDGVNSIFYSLFLLGNIAIFVNSVIRAGRLAYAGEAILTQLKAGKEALQRLKIKTEPTLTDVDVRKLDVLIDCFGSHTGIRPRNFFTVGKAASFSTIGLMMTYYIVLLQFKLSE